MPRKSSKHNKTHKKVQPPAKSIMRAKARLTKPLIIAALTTLASTLLYIALQGPQILRNLRVLPNEFQQTYSKFLAWKNDDAGWQGNWSAHPEGYVDIGDMALSRTDLEISLWSKEGVIDGTIATKNICGIWPLWNFVLLRGFANSNTAELLAFDYISGKEVQFAKLKLEKKKHIMNVSYVEGNEEIFPKNARIAKHPSSDEVEPSPRNDYCKEEKLQFLESLKKVTSKSH